MSSSSVSAPEIIKAPWGLKLFLLVPVLAYVGGLAVSVLRQQMVTFEFIDLIIFYVMLGYLFAVFYATANRKRAIGFTFLTCSSLLTLGGVELIARRLLPPVEGAVPRVPGTKRAAKVGSGMPGLSGVDYTFTVNSMGIRGPETRLQGTDVRILTVGGSTTECMYLPDEKSWPWALQDKLAERLGKRVFVGNAGMGGHNSQHHAYQIRHFELVSEFQWVIVMCGYNEMEVDEEYMNTLKVSETALTPSEKNKAFYRPWSLPRLLHRIYLTLTTKHVVPQDEEAIWLLAEREKRQEHLKLHTFQKPGENLPKYLAFYRSNLKKIIEAARAREVKLLMLTQPSIYRKDLPPELDKLLFMYTKGVGAGSPEYYEEVLTAYNKVMRDLCAEEKVDCLDLASMLPKDTTVFYDDCHFNISGCDKIATILTKFFADKFNGGSQ